MAMVKASHHHTAIWIVHRQSQQRDDSIISKGNNQANGAARTTALGGIVLFHPPWDILTAQPTSPLSSSTLIRLCPIITRSFILTLKP